MEWQIVAGWEMSSQYYLELYKKVGELSIFGLSYSVR